MIYAIGDVHGCYTKLVSLYDKILVDIKRRGLDKATIIFLGDYVDRGPQSKDVLDFLMKLEDTDIIEHIFLKGNHEDMMMEHWEYYPSPVYLNNGGMSTLESFGCISDFSEFSDFSKYVRWINNLDLYHIIDKYVFVHAGIEVGTAIEDQKPEIFIWKKTPSTDLSHYSKSEYIVVHGHTPKMKPEINVKEVNVDTGACFGGRLTAIVLPYEAFPGLLHSDLEFLTS